MISFVNVDVSRMLRDFKWYRDSVTQALVAGRRSVPAIKRCFLPRDLGRSISLLPKTSAVSGATEKPTVRIRPSWKI